MIVRQLSVFLENKSGYLDKVLSQLAMNNIDIKAVFISDTREYGILRILVSNPDEALNVLLNNGFSAKLNKVLCFEVSTEVGSFAKAAACFSEENLNIEYLYGFSMYDKAVAVMKTNDPDKALDVISKNNIKLVTEADLQ